MVLSQFTGTRWGDDCILLRFVTSGARGEAGSDISIPEVRQVSDEVGGHEHSLTRGRKSLGKP